MNFTLGFTPAQLPELRETLDRAMNTWEPQDQPKWLRGLSERVDAALGNPMPVAHTRSAEACNAPISSVLDVIRRDYVPAQPELQFNAWKELAK